MRRSEIWVADIQPKPRPVVLVSRDSHIQNRDLILVAPITTRARGLANEVPLGPEDGVHRPCVADAGSLRLLNKSSLTRHIGALSTAKRAALDAALRFALGLD